MLIIIIVIITIITIIIRCIFSFLFIGRESSTWPANNYLQLSALPQIIFCSCVIETTLFYEDGGSSPRAGRERFVIIKWSKELWSNDKTIFEVVHRKVFWFVSGGQTNYFPQRSGSANNWSARQWQIPIFCSNSSKIVNCRQNYHHLVYLSNNMGDNLLLKFGGKCHSNLHFHMWNYTIAIATFPTVPKWRPG